MGARRRPARVRVGVAMKRASVYMGKSRRAADRGPGGWLCAAAFVTAALPALPAFARPDPILPPPGAQPEPGTSPATGQEAPVDPTDPQVIPPPQGLGCVEGTDQSVCDPSHPGGEQGQLPSNTPSSGWYDDMAKWMYGMQQSLGDLSEYGSKYSPRMEYYSKWLTSVTQQYYALGYTPYGKPRSYGHGHMTRGDFNYYHYYWIRPIYYSLLYYASQYYSTYGGSYDLSEYKSLLWKVVWNYDALVRCGWGLDGDDKGAREDLAADELARKAGVTP